MKKLITFIFIISLSVNTYSQTIPADRDSRSIFSPGTDRISPFEFMERMPEREPTPEVRGTLGVGDALRNFLKPSGYISGDTFADNQIFIGNRFYEVDDIMELSITDGADQYLYPVMELIIRDVSDEYIEFFHTESASLQRIPFDFRPDLAPRQTAGGSLGNGASLKYLGKDTSPLF